MWITKAGLDALGVKLNKLNEDLRNKLIDMGDQAERDPDLPENPVWKQLQVEVGYNLPKRIGELKEIILTARVIEDSLSLLPDRGLKVTLGSRVVIEYENGQQKTFVMVGPYDAEVVENGLSYLSPLGSVIIRSEIGDEKTVATPSGEKRITIVSFDDNGL